MSLTDNEILELERLLYENDIEDSRYDLLKFTRTTLEGFKCKDFHEKYYMLLNQFAQGIIKRLIITMPPQHGKSEGSTRRLPAYILGKNPNAKIAIASYNASFASKFNRDTQRIIDYKTYQDIFPDTTLNKSNVVTVSSNYLRNSVEFEIVGHTGGLKAVGRGGPLTGNKVDVMIMDDLYKDYAEGNSPVIRDAVWDWYISVVKTRLHNNSQELIVFTRWHQEDLIGMLEASGKVYELEDINTIPNLKNDEWLKVNFEAIKDSEPTPLDNRKKGKALWEEVHSTEKLLSVKALDAEKFECLYQGNPKSLEGLLYGDFKTYTDMPKFKMIKSYTDTADSGDNYLCGIVYGIPLASADNHKYVLDVLYTQEGMEKTEPATANMLNRNNVNKARVESNNGGRGFARNVKKLVDNGVNIEWFHQSGNKESRVYSNSASVNNQIIFPEGWHIKWGTFYKHVTRFKKDFKANKFDDAPDVLTGIIETEEKTDH